MQQQNKKIQYIHAARNRNEKNLDIHNAHARGKVALANILTSNTPEVTRHANGLYSRRDSTAEDTFLNCGYLIVEHICPPTLR